MHRYEHSEFFPKSTEGDHTQAGKGAGTGFNVNIPWNKVSDRSPHTLCLNEPIVAKFEGIEANSRRYYHNPQSKMGDSDYITAFQRIIMPIAYEFDPELVLVSAGFDAVVGDPLGHYHLTPEVYGYFTHWLSALANGRVILCLEGGYNVNSISHAMTMCTKALLGDPLPMLHSAKKPANANCLETVHNVLATHQPYWKSLKFNRKLPAFDALPDSTYESVNAITRKLNVLTMDDDKAAHGTDGVEVQIDPQPGASASDGASSSGAGHRLADHLTENAGEDMYVPYPRFDCPHLATLTPNTLPSGN